MRHRETTTDPYSSVGKLVMAEIDERGYGYKYSCLVKIGREDCIHIYEKCWGGYHCLDCMTYFPGMVRYESRGVINWNVQA